MKLIVISAERPIQEEGKQINALMASGDFNFHLRKKQSDEQGLKRLLSEIRKEFYPRLVLHQHFELAIDFQLGGIHLPEAKRTELEKLKRDGQTILSTSIHQLADFSSLAFSFDYVFYSPVFPSISKPGYSPSLDFDRLKSQLMTMEDTSRLIALGGITSDNFRLALQVGFGGVALLGAVWEKSHPEKFLQDFIIAFNVASRK